MCPYENPLLEELGILVRISSAQFSHRLGFKEIPERKVVEHHQEMF